MRLRKNIYASKNDRTAHSRSSNNRFQEFRVRRTCPITGKLVEMLILMTKRHFLLAHQAFKNRTGNRKLIPYLTETEYRFLFEGTSPFRLRKAYGGHGRDKEDRLLSKTALT
jgi:hypothetical protein